MSHFRDGTRHGGRAHMSRCGAVACGGGGYAVCKLEADHTGSHLEGEWLLVNRDDAEE